MPFLNPVYLKVLIPKGSLLFRQPIEVDEWFLTVWFSDLIYLECCIFSATEFFDLFIGPLPGTLPIQFSPLTGFVNFSDPQEEQNRDHQHGHGD
jgi:hypothetical protein